ncbi:MAG: hypothetical protein IJQ36_07770 [Oscillospiraceae bacterium]|nr:hypothetical protein [Oscillospiraceae bacterium]
MSGKQRKTEYLWAALMALVILGYLAVFTVIDFRGFARLATSDMYEDTLVARLMWEQKTLFPKNYLFGNQLYVAATPVLAALFYGLTGSMNRAMAWATFCMSVFLLLSMLWMLRASVKRPGLRIAAVLVFLSSIFGPFSVFREEGQQLFFAMCSFYACYLIGFFVVLGDYVRALSDEARRPGALLLSVLLCFALGMQSLRQTCVLILPLVCFEALAALYRLVKKQPLYPAGRRMRLWRTLSYAAANGLGLVFVRMLPVRRHEIFEGASVFSGASVLEKLRDVHTALITVSGYDVTRQHEHRLFFILLFLSLTLLVLAAVFLLLRRRAYLQSAAACWLVALLGCLAVVAASFVSSVQLRPIYLFLYYTLPALSLVLIGERLRPRLRAALMAFFCVLSAANLYFSYHDDLRVALSQEPTPAQQIADWAVGQGYELVYGNQSTCAPYVAVCSDGALTAGCWRDDFPFKVSPHINIRDVYHIEDYKRAIFVFLDTEAPALLEECAANGAEMTPHGQYGPYLVYTASQQCLWPVTELIDYAPRFPEYN